MLVVENDQAVRRSLQLLLRGRGLDVRAYSAAPQAIADPETRRAACLIADLVMPEVDGISLLAALRRDGWNGAALLISGFLTEALERKALGVGYAAVLPKPVAHNRLVETVERLLGTNPPKAA